MAGKHLDFVDGLIYNDPTSMDQRICLTLVDRPEPRLLRSATKPFATLHLKEAVYTGNFPIAHLKIFLLSASISGQKIDVVVSPKNDRLDLLLRDQ